MSSGFCLYLSNIIASVNLRFHVTKALGIFQTSVWVKNRLLLPIHMAIKVSPVIYGTECFHCTDDTVNVISTSVTPLYLISEYTRVYKISIKFQLKKHTSAFLTKVCSFSEIIMALLNKHHLLLRSVLRRNSYLVQQEMRLQEQYLLLSYPFSSLAAVLISEHISLGTS